MATGKWQTLDDAFVKNFLEPKCGSVLGRQMVNYLRDELGIGKLFTIQGKGNRTVFHDEANQIIKFNPKILIEFKDLQHSHQTASAIDDIVLKPFSVFEFESETQTTSIEIFPKALTGWNFGVNYFQLKASEHVLEQELARQGFKISDLAPGNVGYLVIPEKQLHSLEASRKYQLPDGQYLLAHNNQPLAFPIDTGCLERVLKKTELSQPTPWWHPKIALRLFKKHDIYFKKSEIYYPGIQEEFIPQLRTKIPLIDLHNNVAQRPDIEHHYVTASGNTWQTRIHYNDVQTTSTAKDILR